MLINYNELVIDNELPHILEGYITICKCDLCLEDIKALTLNNLKPLYASTEKGNVYLKLKELEKQFKADITTEIVRSIEIVSNNPRHAI